MCYPSKQSTVFSLAVILLVAAALACTLPATTSPTPAAVGITAEEQQLPPLGEEFTESELPPIEEAQGADEQDVDSLLDTVLEAYDQIAEIIQAMQALASNAADNSLSNDERLSLQTGIEQLISEINQTAESVEFDGRKVLYGTEPTLLSTEGNFSRAGTPRQRIIDAVKNLENGNQVVEFTYSFIIPGTDMDEGISVAFGDYVDDSVTSEEFKHQIREALTAWEDFFEKVFNTANGYGGNLEVIFVDLGDEQGNSFASSQTVEPYLVPGSENLGDLRYGMEDLSDLRTATPHSPTGAPKAGEGDSSGDIHFNTQINWRLDRQSRDSGTTSIMLVAVHEIGHGFAYGHDETSMQTPLNPRVIVQGSFGELSPNGLFFEGSSELAGAVAMYGLEAMMFEPGPFSFEDGTEINLPAINAATLGTNAIKVRSLEEATEAIELLNAAARKLEEYRNSISVMGGNAAPTPAPSAALVEADAFFFGCAYVDSNGDGQLDSDDVLLEDAVLTITTAGDAGFSGYTSASGCATVIIPGGDGDLYPVIAQMAAHNDGDYTLIGPAEMQLEYPESSASFLFTAEGPSQPPDQQDAPPAHAVEQARETYPPYITGALLMGNIPAPEGLDVCLAERIGADPLAALRARAEQPTGVQNDQTALCLAQLGTPPESLDDIPPPGGDLPPGEAPSGGGPTGAIQATPVESQYAVAPANLSGWFTTGQEADILLSGIDFNNTGGSLLFNHPKGIASDGVRLLLADGNNNRVLIWNSLPTGDTPPDLVLGQPDFTSNNPGSGRRQLNWPVSVAAAGGRVVVADTYNDRILIWNSFPTENATPADIVLQGHTPGQPEGSQSKGDFHWPWGVWTDGERLAVTSTMGGYLLIWNTIPRAMINRRT